MQGAASQIPCCVREERRPRRMDNRSQGGTTEGNPANGENDILMVDQGFLLTHRAFGLS